MTAQPWKISRRIILFAIAGSVTATALLAIGILLLGDFGETEGRILGTTALLAGYGLLALPAGFLLDRSRHIALALAALTLVVLGFALAVASIWAETPPAGLGKSVATVTAFALASTQTAALASRRRQHESSAIRRLFHVSTGLALVAATMATVAAWAEIEDNEAYYRLLAALVVLDVLLVVLQPILSLARPAGPPFRLRLLVAPGESVETNVQAADFAAAVAKAIRMVERRRGRVLRVERVEMVEPADASTPPEPWSPDDEHQAPRDARSGLSASRT